MSQPTALPATTVRPEKGETYLDIVWGQFRKKAFAYWSMWAMLPLFVIAIFAPLIAGNVPFVFDDGETTRYPWFRWLFEPGEPVNYVFNMMMLAALLWTPPMLLWAYLRRDLSKKRLIGIGLLSFIALAALLCIAFRIPGIRVHDIYRTENFPELEYRLATGSPPTKVFAVYPLLPFGYVELDRGAQQKEPLYRKPRFVEVDGRRVERWTESNDGFVHLLGTDTSGRDVLARLIYGTRISLSIGIFAVAIFMAIGVTLGALAGYFGGWIDQLISRVIEVVIVFPAFFLILAIVALVGPSIFIIMLVIGLTGWTTVARLVRGEVLRQRSIEYVLAARALGASHLRVLFLHALPNSLSPALVAVPFGISSAIIVEASLSLLGYGVKVPTPSWGELLAQARTNYELWWLIVFPSLAIFVTVTLFNQVGNGLRDAMDPKLRR
ncbi:MAG TPA: ABC transporter permease [Pirellulaceae bacterium]|jgi:ABC-type dipeptide/oligopeptide/nickel transport system permease subunit|nr:ABC transporter permease [Pirellulaceae bacterium]